MWQRDFTTREQDLGREGAARGLNYYKGIMEDDFCFKLQNGGSLSSLDLIFNSMGF